MADLPDGEYYTFRQAPGEPVQFAVAAQRTDAIHVVHTCPFCRSSYKKNGEPMARAKRVMHWHGHGGDRSVRYVGQRIPHCDRRFHWMLPNVHIYITGDTKHTNSRRHT